MSPWQRISDIVTAGGLIVCRLRVSLKAWFSIFSTDSTGWVGLFGRRYDGLAVHLKGANVNNDFTSYDTDTSTKNNACTSYLFDDR
jgi:hypothetical protein